MTDAELRALIDSFCDEADLARRDGCYSEELTLRKCASRLESLIRPQEPEQAARERLGNGAGRAADKCACGLYVGERVFGTCPNLMHWCEGDAAERSRT